MTCNLGAATLGAGCGGDTTTGGGGATGLGAGFVGSSSQAGVLALSPTLGAGAAGGGNEVLGVGRLGVVAVLCTVDEGPPYVCQVMTCDG